MVENCYGWNNNTDCEQCEKFKECITDTTGDNTKVICQCQNCLTDNEITVNEDNYLIIKFVCSQCGINQITEGFLDKGGITQC